MALSIRLTRGGAKKRPYYRIVVADSRAPRDGRFIEKLGSYNPLLAKDSPERVKLDAERIGHWLSVGAQPSDRVLRFLDAAGIRERAARSNPKKGEPGEKAKARVEEREGKAAAAAEAAEAAAAAPPAAEEPVTEDAPTEEVVAEEAAAEAPAADETAATEDAAAQEAPAEEAPAEEAPAEEAPAEAAPADEASNQGESAPEPVEGADENAPATADSPEPVEAAAETEAVSTDEPAEGANDTPPPADETEKAE